MSGKELKTKKRKVRADKGKQRGKYKRTKPRSKKRPENKVVHVCKKCGHTTANKTNYKVHYLNSHASLEERIAQYSYYCKTCNFGVMSESLYKTHLKTKKHKRLIAFIEK